MTTTWQSDDAPEPMRLGLTSWVLILLRGVPTAILVFGLFALLLIIRLIENPLFGLHRPITPHITVFACRNALRLMGIRYETQGTPMEHPGAMAANHASWLDIFVLNAAAPIYFVSKAEVARWPGIGWLARGTGTVFIERDRRQAKEHNALFRQRLLAGHKILFFPEGTSTDGMRVLPFKPTLFEAFFSADLKDTLWLQPVTVTYFAPKSADPRFYGWWGDMGFGEHLLKTLGAWPQGRVRVTYHPHVRVSAFDSRKALAAELEKTVRAGLDRSG